jgi:hypothetical protein
MCGMFEALAPELLPYDDDSFDDKQELKAGHIIRKSLPSRTGAHARWQSVFVNAAKKRVSTHKPCVK